MKYHSLTEKILKVPNEVLWSQRSKGTPTQQIDQIIREWLEEKAKEFGGGLGKGIYEVLELTEEKTLEEKFKDYLGNHLLDYKHYDYRGEISDLARIAEAHFKESK